MTKTNHYNAEAIEVLTGLDPVKKRPGMYTDTSNPNHLAQEVIDNSVDEAMAGFANKIQVNLYSDASLEVIDNGRGMPVDKHPEEKVSGVEVILTRLHAGGKFSNKNYQFSGGLHGVGVSVVNALSQHLEVTIKREGKQYTIAFANGDKVSELKQVGAVGARESGTRLRFWPNASFFDSPKFVLPALQHILRAKAVLCPRLQVSLYDQTSEQSWQWYYQDGLVDYMKTAIQAELVLPNEPLTGNFSSQQESVEWALVWLPEGGQAIAESYVNLIPTALGGTHVNGLRIGLTEAVREFCEFRRFVPKGIKISPDDVWDKCCYVLSVKMQEPQFSGQTKERLSSRECSAFVSGVVKDAFGLWLNQHIDLGEQIAQLAIANAQQRLRSGKKVIRKKNVAGPALPGKLADCLLQDLNRCELFLVEGDSAGGSAKQARDKEFQAVMPLRGKILNTWEVDSLDVLASKEVHDLSIAIGIEPGSDNMDSLRYGKVCILADADSDGAHIATLLCALFLRHFQPLVRAGIICVAMPPLYRIDVGKEVFYALDDAEKEGILDRIVAEKKRSKPSIQRFKGLGEMNPLQLRETTMAPNTRRLVQLTLEQEEQTIATMDLLLAKKRSSERRRWLQEKGDLVS